MGGRIGGAAHFAVVAVLVFGVAFRAFAFYEAVGQNMFFWVEKLLDGAAFDFAVGFEGAVDFLGIGFVFRRMGAVIVVIADAGNR